MGNSKDLNVSQLFSCNAVLGSVPRYQETLQFPREELGAGENFMALLQLQQCKILQETDNIQLRCLEGLNFQNITFADQFIYN
jgi:hypothetical protein